MINERRSAEAVSLKGEVYVFGGWDEKENLTMSVKKYSLSTHTWKQLANMYDNRDEFCVCTFMDKIFIIGGTKSRTGGWYRVSVNSCLQFNTKANTWKEVSIMNETRSSAPRALFEGNVVVTGG